MIKHMRRNSRRRSSLILPESSASLRNLNLGDDGSVATNVSDLNSIRQQQQEQKQGDIYDYNDLQKQQYEPLPPRCDTANQIIQEILPFTTLVQRERLQQTIIDQVLYANSNYVTQPDAINEQQPPIIDNSVIALTSKSPREIERPTKEHMQLGVEGTGKTCMAAMLALRTDVRMHYCGGIAWINMGHRQGFHARGKETVVENGIAQDKNDNKNKSSTYKSNHDLIEEDGNKDDAFDAEAELEGFNTDIWSDWVKSTDVNEGSSDQKDNGILFNGEMGYNEYRTCLESLVVQLNSRSNSNSYAIEEQEQLSPSPPHVTRPQFEVNLSQPDDNVYIRTKKETLMMDRAKSKMTEWLRERGEEMRRINNVNRLHETATHPPPILIIMDDVYNIEDIEWFQFDDNVENEQQQQPLESSCANNDHQTKNNRLTKILFTTRICRSSVLDVGNATWIVIQVGNLKKVQAVSLLLDSLDHDHDSLSSYLQQIQQEQEQGDYDGMYERAKAVVKRCKYNPLIVSTLARHLKENIQAQQQQQQQQENEDHNLTLFIQKELLHINQTLTTLFSTQTKIPVYGSYVATILYHVLDEIILPHRAKLCLAVLATLVDGSTIRNDHFYYQERRVMEHGNDGSSAHQLLDFSQTMSSSISGNSCCCCSSVSTIPTPWIPIKLAAKLWAETLGVGEGEDNENSGNINDGLADRIISMYDILSNLGLISTSLAGVISNNTDCYGPNHQHNNTNSSSSTIQIRHELFQRYGTHLKKIWMEGRMQSFEKQWIHALHESFSLQIEQQEDNNESSNHNNTSDARVEIDYNIQKLPQLLLRFRRLSDISQLLSSYRFLVERFRLFGIVRGTRVHMVDFRSFYYQLVVRQTKRQKQQKKRLVSTSSYNNNMRKLCRQMKWSFVLPEKLLPEDEQVSETICKVVIDALKKYSGNSNNQGCYDALEIGTALYEVGNNLFQLSLFDIALDAYQSVLDRFQTTTTSPSLSLSNTHIPLIAASHYAIGLILLFTEMGNNHKEQNSQKKLQNQSGSKHLTLKAIESFKTALELWVTQYGLNNEYTGQTNHWLGLACRQISSNTEAKTYLTESLRIRKIIFNHLGYADTLHEIACVHYILGEHCKSVECYQGALKTKKEFAVHNDDFPPESLALSLDEMRKVHSEMDMIEDANKCCTESAQLIGQSRFMEVLPPESVKPRSGGGSTNEVVGSSIDSYSSQSKSGTASSATSVAISNTNDASPSPSSSVGNGTCALKRFSININQNDTDDSGENSYDYMGRMQFKNGFYEDAISSFKNCLSILNQKPGDNDLDIASIFSSMAITHLLMDDERFKHYQEQAVRAFNKKLGYNNLKAALCLHNIGCAHARKKRLEESLSSFEDALRIRILHLGNHEDVAITLCNMSFILFEQKEYFMSLELLNESKGIMELRLGSNHKMVADVTHYIGHVYDLKGEQSNALAWYKKTLVLKKIAYSDDDVVLGIDYSCIGNILYDRKEYEEALFYLENALRVRQAYLPDDNLDIATNLYDIGYVYHDMGKTADAINFLEKALKMRKILLGFDHYSIEDTNSSLGHMYAKQGDHSKALASLDEALRIHQTNETYEKVADTLNNMAIVHRSAGDVDKAIVCYEEALQILHKCASGDGMKSHDIYFNLGNLYDGTNSNEKAMECYNHALRGTIEAFGENSNQVAAVLSNMCTVHFKLGERDVALTNLEEVLRIRKHNFGDSHEEVATAYYNLGVLHLRRGELPIARVRFEDALESFRAIGIGDSNQIFANALRNVGLIAQQM